MSSLKKDKKILTKKRIMEESSHLFSLYGFEATSTKMISEAVGIAEGTLFNYFDTKAHIFLEVLTKTMLEMAIEVPSIPDAQREVACIIYQWIAIPLQEFLSIPKSLLRSLAGVLAQNPALFHQLAHVDYRLLEALEQLLEELIVSKQLVSTDCKALSEILYSSVLMDILFYLYEENRTIDQTLHHIEHKTKMILSAYKIDKE